VIRAFVAVLLDDGLRERVAAVIERLRPLARAVAWVPPRNLHVTLQFLGGQSEERLQEAEAALAEVAAESAPVDVTFHGVGAFPGMERPRILWVGLAQGALEVRGLQARVVEALAARGFPREERPWHPHLTIGRVHDERRWRREAGPPLRTALAQAAATTFGVLRIADVALMRSDLSPAGARYTVRRALPLGALVLLASVGAAVAQTAGIAPLNALDCPATAPVKTYISRTGSRLYYEPEHRLYSQVKPERCFVSVAEASAAGYQAGRGTREMPKAR
jgi:2'-5' RNA ligase